jgi:hypothetical protein
MKHILFIFITATIVTILGSCRQSAEKGKQDSVDLITTQTLGLAYLEEFKLEEAETEFLKYIKLAPDDKSGYANLGLTYLRMGKYPEAEKRLLKAIRIDNKDADIRLILATVYQMDDNVEKAIAELNKALEISPGHIKVLYMLSELYTVSSDPQSAVKRKDCVASLAEKAPGNLVPKLSLIEIYIKEGQADSALQYLEILQKQFPEFPKEAIGYYQNTLDLLGKGNTKDALVQFTIFYNYMKVTPPYQAGIMDLKGPGGSLIGFPIITFDQLMSNQDTQNRPLLEVIKFTDVTVSAGLGDPVGKGNHPASIKTADFDGDGDTDIYTWKFDPATSTYKSFLFKSDFGRFTDAAATSGLTHSGNEVSAQFADFDNDGFQDLFIVTDDGCILYRNEGGNLFENATNKAGIGKAGVNKGLFFDLDHDGDLDLYECRQGENFLLRNNADGTFTEQAREMGIAGGNENSLDAAFGDFDDNGVIDFVVVNEKSVVLYSNQRQSRFKDITSVSGLQNIEGATSVETGDYNNDGFLDLLLTSSANGSIKLCKNKGDGSFVPVENKSFARLDGVKTNDARFFDFDNDGFLDILIGSSPNERGVGGLHLYHNDGMDTFSDVSGLLPETNSEIHQIEVFDYNNDGDLDILTSDTKGDVRLYRNDGGNMNHYVDMKLVGLRAGSAKNNHFGIGAKVEIRSGDLYQSMVVTDPDVHFGLGHRDRADVIRITWTNGVPQNIFMPQADRALIEAQTLKGSCPFLYTWNGQEFVFVKDITWRSALGMPLGIMSGETKYGFADASDDFIKIPGEFLKAEKGKYTLQVTSELWETIYMDRLQLAVVDHKKSTDVFVPEQFTPPPFPGFKLYQTDEKIAPVLAVNEKGEDVLDLILKEDDNYVAGFAPEKYQGLTELHSLTLDPGAIASNDNLIMYLNGWIFPTDASINFALSQTKSITSNAPVIQVINKKGEWQTVIENLGFPMGKDKTVIADLNGIFLTNDKRIRIVTNMEIYWDQVFFSKGNSETPMTKTFLEPVSADFHYRGFSAMYRKGGRYGPHWFDYYKVDKSPKWRDLTGNYTRYGDVLPLLTESDSRYVISNAGDEMTVEFDAGQLPPLQDGWKRDFFIRSVGWVKDGDLNTALGNTVEPLPYHGMKNYPPAKNDSYPNDPVSRKYQEEYNTRVVTAADYRNAIKPKSENESSK